MFGVAPLSDVFEIVNALALGYENISVIGGETIVSDEPRPLLVRKLWESLGNVINKILSQLSPSEKHPHQARPDKACLRTKKSLKKSKI